MQRLELNEFQFDIGRKFYLNYQREFEDLRIRRIEPFINNEQASALRYEGEHTAALEPMFTKAMRIRLAIAALDNDLFKRVAETLKPAQLQRLPLVRLERQRERFFDLSALSDAGLPQILDVSYLCREGLEDPVDEEYTALMDHYERKLTAMLGEAVEELEKAQLSIARDLDAHNLHRDRLADGVVPDDELESAKARAELLMADAVQNTRDIVVFNIRFLNRLKLLLPESDWLSLRNEYVQRVYPHAMTDAVNLSRTALLWTQALEVLPSNHAQARDLLTALLHEVQRQIDRSLQLSTIIKTYKRKQDALKGDARDRDWKVRYDKHIRLAQSQIEEVRVQMVVLLGTELASGILSRKFQENKPLSSDSQGPESVRQDADDQNVDGQSDVRVDSALLLPSFISAPDLDVIEQLLGSSFEENPVARVVTDEYEAEAGRVKRSEIRQLTTGLIELLGAIERNEAKQSPELVTRELDKIFQERARIARKIVRLNGQLLDDVLLIDESVLSRRQEQLKLLELRRAHALSGIIRSRGSAEAHTDIIAILLRVGGFDFDNERVASLLNEYGKTLTSAIQQRMENAVQLTRSRIEWDYLAPMIMEVDDGGNGTSQDDPVLRYGKALREADEQLMNSNIFIVEKNHELFDHLRELLPAEVSRRIQRDYYQASYPELFDLDRDLCSSISALMLLDSLAHDQLLSVGQIASKYCGRVDGYRQEYIGLRQTIDSWIPNDEAEDDRVGVVYRARTRSVRIAADWADLNDATILELASLLQASQLVSQPWLTDRASRLGR